MAVLYAGGDISKEIEEQYEKILDLVIDRLERADDKACRNIRFRKCFTDYA